MKEVRSKTKKVSRTVRRRIWRSYRTRTVQMLAFFVFALALPHSGSANTIIGSPGAAFQSWTLDNLNNSCPPGDTFHRNCTPYWDYPTNYSFPLGDQANVGYCLTGTGGGAGLLNPGPPPGPIPFWGMSFDSVTDTGGAIDPNFFFNRDTPNPLQATLELQLSRVPSEINEFGWFETDSTGSMIGPLHRLFVGSPNPDPAGTTVTFTPTQFYGYYYLDFSEGNCFVATLSSFNTPGCSAAPNALFHNLAAFTTDPTSAQATFWIAGLNAAIECVGADCNLTLVKVEPILMADLAVTKTDLPDPVTVGNNLTYTVTVTNNGPDTATSVTVTDNLPAETTFVSCSSTGGGVCSGSGNNRTVTFASLASGGSEAITFVASVNCSVADGTVISNTATVISSIPDPNSNNNSMTATTTASNPPPTITGASANPSLLWPPNHKLVNVTVNYNVTDNCPLPANSCTLTVTSNEAINGTGDGNTSPDWIILDAHHVQLRAERAGKGNGRVYTIGITCIDSGGNSSHQSVEVRVSHDQGRKKGNPDKGKPFSVHGKHRGNSVKRFQN